MFAHVRPCVLAAALAWPFVLPPVEAELRFVPEEGATVALVFRETADAEVVEETWITVVDGERGEQAGGELDSGVSWSFELSGEIVDVYDSVEDDRVTGLTRRFEEFDGMRLSVIEMDDGDEEIEETLVTPLLGRTFTFEWDEDDEEYEVTLDEGDDEDLDEILAGSAAIDAFGAWFLPEDPAVEEGDEWDAGVEAWSAFSEYGGDFWVDVEDADPPTGEDAEASRSAVEQLRESAEGEVLCSFDGFEEVDGVELAVISIAIDVTESYELDDEVEEGDESITIVEEVEIETTGEGRCLWNTETNRPHSIELELEIEETSVSTETIDDGDQIYGLEMTTVTRTNTTMDYAFEVR